MKQTYQPLARLSLFLGMGLFACIALGAVGGLFSSPPDHGSTQNPIEGIGGHLQLTSHRGSLIDTEKTAKPFLVFFGFTHCPEICPTTLAELTQTLQDIQGKEASDLRIYFISVDLERDNQEFLASYMESFDPRIIALTGSRAQIDAVLETYKVYVKKITQKNGEYSFDHTALVYLMNGKGQLVSTLSYQEDPSTRLQKITKLLQ